MKQKTEDRPPLAYRLSLAAGRPFGVRWVGDYTLAVVYEMEQYHGCKGPGFFRINPVTQTVRTTISLAPDFIAPLIEPLQTKDALQMGLSLAVAYRFDPRNAPRDKAAIYVNWQAATRRAIVTYHTERSLQAILPAYYAEQVCRGEVFAEVERQLVEMLTTRLSAVAMEPMVLMVLRVKVPPALQSRFETVVQRGVNIQDFSQYEPYELNQAMRIELIENLRQMTLGKQYFNLPDTVEGALPPVSDPLPRRIARPDAAPPDSSPPPEESPRKPRSRL